MKFIKSALRKMKTVESQSTVRFTDVISTLIILIPLDAFAGYYVNHFAGNICMKLSFK